MRRYLSAVLSSARPRAKAGFRRLQIVSNTGDIYRYFGYGYWYGYHTDIYMLVDVWIIRIWILDEKISITLHLLNHRSMFFLFFFVRDTFFFVPSFCLCSLISRMVVRYALPTHDCSKGKGKRGVGRGASR